MENEQNKPTESQVNLAPMGKGNNWMSNPLILIIAGAVILGIIADVAVCLNLQPEEKGYDIAYTKNDYSNGNTNVPKPDTNDNTVAKDITTDESIVADWETYTASLDGHKVTIKHPASWNASASNYYMSLGKRGTRLDSGDYSISIRKNDVTYNKDTFAHIYGNAQDIKINDNSAIYSRGSTTSDTATDVYLINIGDEQYMCSVIMKTPSDQVGSQIISTLQIK